MGLHKIYHASILLIALYIFKIIFSALKNDSRGSVIMVSAFIVVIIASVNDMLTYWLLVITSYSIHYTKLYDPLYFIHGIILILTGFPLTVYKGSLSTAVS